MYFQRTNDLHVAPTKHLFHLRMEGLSYFELERGYRVLIYLELSKRLEELRIDEFRWVKPEILNEANKFYNGSSDEFE